jgi:hypothetical protein
MPVGSRSSVWTSVVCSRSRGSSPPRHPRTARCPDDHRRSAAFGEDRLDVLDEVELLVGCRGDEIVTLNDDGPALSCLPLSDTIITLDLLPNGGFESTTS